MHMPRPPPSRRDMMGQYGQQQQGGMYGQPQPPMPGQSPMGRPPLPPPQQQQHIGFNSNPQGGGNMRPDSSSNGQQQHVSPSSGAMAAPASDADDLLKSLLQSTDAASTSNTSSVVRAAQVTKPLSLVISVNDLGPGKSYPLKRADCENVFRQFGIVTDFVSTGDAAARVYFQTAEQAEQVVKNLHGRALPNYGINGGSAHLSVILDVPLVMQAVESTVKYPEEVLSDRPFHITHFKLKRGLFAGEPKFNVVQRILGDGHRHMREIVRECGHAVDIHLKGIPDEDASDDDRMALTVCSLDEGKLVLAVAMIRDLLDRVSAMFMKWVDVTSDCSVPEGELYEIERIDQALMEN